MTWATIQQIILIMTTCFNVTMFFLYIKKNSNLRDKVAHLRNIRQTLEESNSTLRLERETLRQHMADRIPSPSEIRSITNTPISHASQLNQMFSGTLALESLFYEPITYSDLKRAADAIRNQRDAGYITSREAVTRLHIVETIARQIASDLILKPTIKQSKADSVSEQEWYEEVAN